MIDNGWEIAKDGSVYAIINGSAYEVDAADDEIASLPPGEYTDDQVFELSKDRLAKERAAVAIEDARLKMRSQFGWLFRSTFDESQHPRDEAGRFTSGGGSSSGATVGTGKQPLPAQSMSVVDSYDVRTEVLVNQRDSELMDFARGNLSEAMAGATYPVPTMGRPRQPDDQRVNGAVRVMRDKAGNLYAWTPEIIHDRIIDGIDEVFIGEGDRDDWYLVGNRFQSNRTDERLYAEQTNLRGIDPNTPQAIRERQRAAQRVATDWIRKGRANAAASKSHHNVVRLWGIFDESKHPRDESGKFTSGGGAGGAGAGPTFSAAKDTNAKKQAQVKAAVAAIPAQHAETLKNVPVSFVPFVRDQSGKHTIEGWYDPDKRSIEIAEKTSFTFGKRGWFDRPKVYEVDVKDLDRATVRELGYAYNHAKDWSLNKAIQGELTTGIGRMTDTEKKDGAYFVNSSQDSFAELYALAYSPNKVGPYFGRMTRDRAESVFAEALAKVKAM